MKKAEELKLYAPEPKRPELDAALSMSVAEGHQACAAGGFESERGDPQDEIYLSNKKEDRLRNPPIEQVYYT